MGKLEAGTHEAETSLLQYLRQAGPSMLDDLARQLPRFTRNQIFAAVDRLSFRGEVQIRHLGRSEYMVFLAGTAPAVPRSGESHPSRDVEKNAATGGEKQ